MFPLIFKSLCAHKISFVNILPGLICIWNDVYEYVQTHFFLCALVSRLLCARTRPRGNISQHNEILNSYPNCYILIHSFILNIYIAPLQENYSEALPTPARSNKAVLR